MLQKLSEEVAKCQRQARKRGNALSGRPEADKQGYFALERRWLMLAESYELVDVLRHLRARQASTLPRILL